MTSCLHNLVSHASIKTAAPAIFMVGFTSVAIALTPLSSLAQDSYYYVGEIDGEKILVNLDSIDLADDSAESGDAIFSYLLGDVSIAAQAHCVGAGAWTTLEDETFYYAQSQASRDMVRIVCSYLTQPIARASEPSIRPESRPASRPEVLPTPIEPPTPDDSPVTIEVEPYRPVQPTVSSSTASLQTALVYDPSSNVRATPNGQILCSIDAVSYINIYGRVGDWYDTDACGNDGVIHSSQISFD